MHLTSNLTTLGFTPHETTTPVGPGVGAVLLDLRAQRRFRVEQLRELVVSTAEALANVDEARLQVNHLLTVAAQAALADIEGALECLEAGTYGTCSGCGQAIAQRRLAMLPTARLCTMCHYLSEHGGLGHTGVARPAPATRSYAGLS
ncbi:MAG: TraR/DksA C4-type zinc finger protein [Terracoccus sp.]